MKKVFLILFVFVMLIYPNFANAVLIPTTSIGNALNDGTWFTANTSTPFLTEGTRGGFAYGFSLDQGYKVSSITGFLEGINFHEIEVAPTTISFTLYQGSSYMNDGKLGPFPSTNVIFQSENFSVPYDSNIAGYTSSTHLHLDAGEYWLGINGYAPVPEQLQAFGYQLEGKPFANTHTPEPATMFLLGGGLVGSFWRRRKFSKA